MNLKVFAVFDTKTKTYAQPFFMLHTGQALRAFERLSNDAESEVSRYPTDFSLFEMGSFDDQLGLLSPTIPPHNLGLAASFKEAAQPTPFDRKAGAL